MINEPFESKMSSKETMNRTASFNKIDIHDLVAVLLKNEELFKIKKTNETYVKLQDYINSAYSWYKVSEDLYHYFMSIISQV